MHHWIDENVTKAASKAADAELCAHCLGRTVAKAGSGMSNEERGLQLADHLSLELASPCALCGDVFRHVHRFARAVADAVLSVESGNFLVGCRVDPDIAQKEKDLWKETGDALAEPIKSELNREIGKAALPLIDRAVEFNSPEVVAVVDTRFASVELDVAPVFIAGRYLKLSREIPQTVWPCRACRGKGCPRCGQSGKMYPSSVQEEIGGPALAAVDGKEHFFHGMGREDVDALMLGDGRPFVIELRQPRRRDVDLDSLEMGINRSELAQVRELRIAERSEVAGIKAATPSKTYRAKVLFEGKVNKERVNEVAKSFTKLHIDQRTPSRVSHRRADMVRRREIVSMEVEDVAEDAVVLLLEAESGTYVKEFVSGDEGRTTPSLSDALGLPCTVETLDVIAINDR